MVFLMTLGSDGTDTVLPVVAVSIVVPAGADATYFFFGTFYFYGAVVLLLLPIIMKVLPETKVSDLSLQK